MELAYHLYEAAPTIKWGFFEDLCLYLKMPMSGKALAPIFLRDMSRFAFVVLLLLGGAPGLLQAAPRTVHVFVALADNQHQGIIPVPAVLGNGSDPQRNLYWGAAYGGKTFFKAGKEWELVSSSRPSKAAILERCIFKNRQKDVVLVA